MAAEVGVSASTISLWKHRGILPRHEKHLDRLVELSGDDRAKVYTLAGRGQWGMEVPDLLPEVIALAKHIDNLLSVIDDPRVREFALTRLRASINDLSSALEEVQDLIRSEPNGEGEKP